MDIEYNNLDDDWINEFEKTDKLYQDFYKDDLYYINLRVIYVNRSNEIDKITHESFLLTNKNNISREEVLGILKKISTDNERNYTLLSILRYNINLEPDEIKNYLTNEDNSNFLSVIKNIDAVTFEKSISMFHDLNDIIFILYEKSKELKKSNKDSNNNTKKIYLRNLTSNRKTIKKRYKD
jgi:hypothetical protein